MNFAAILAGGSGIRMGNSDKPKQYYMLGDKPILIHTLEKFCLGKNFERVLVLCPESWIQQTNDLVSKYCAAYIHKIVVVPGGGTRNETIENAVLWLEKHCDVDDESIIVTHDAVRPFVSHRIIQANIEAAIQHAACDTVIPVTDTIVESEDGRLVDSIPKRDKFYQGQTPQSFKLKKLSMLMSRLTDEEKQDLTDACRIFVMNGEDVVLLAGEASNIKITFPHDMRVARALLEDGCV